MTEKSTSARACEALREALAMANHRIEHLEIDLEGRDRQLRSLNDRGALLVLLEGQTAAKIAEVNASADVKKRAVDTLGPAVKPILDVIMREIGMTKTPTLSGEAMAALNKIMVDKDLTRILQITAGDDGWAALLEVFAGLVSIGPPDTIALRYQEARKTRPDMLPIQEFCEQAVRAELSRRGIKTRCEPTCDTLCPRCCPDS